MHHLLPEDIQEIFPLLLENVPTGVAVLDRGLRQLCINSRHASVNHMSEADHLGKRLEEFLPQAAMVIKPKLQFVLDTGQPLVKQEIRGKAGVDGHTVHRIASYYPWKGQAGDIRGVLAIIQDSTLDNVAEQLLQSSQHKLLKVLDNLFSFVGVLGSVDVIFTAALTTVLGLNKAKIATWHEHHERFLTFVPPQKCSQPEGLSRKMAIHCVMLLDNKQLLPLYESDHLSDVNLADFLSRLVFLMEAIYWVEESRIKLIFLGAEP
ncbi:PAS domain-containing protein, partial [Iodobacter sp. LRB]